MKELNISLVGMNHRVTPSTRNMIASYIERNGPVKCSLVREPSNEHDSHAVKVVCDEGPYRNLHLGYLPRTVAAEFSPAMKKGEIKVTSVYLAELEPRDGDGELVIKLSKAKENPGKQAKRKPT